MQSGRDQLERLSTFISVDAEVRVKRKYALETTGLGYRNESCICNIHRCIAVLLHQRARPCDIGCLEFG